MPVEDGVGDFAVTASEVVAEIDRFSIGGTQSRPVWRADDVSMIWKDRSQIDLE